MVKFNAISINTCQHWSHASIERGLVDYNLNIYVKYLSPEKNLNMHLILWIVSVFQVRIWTHMKIWKVWNE